MKQKSNYIILAIVLFLSFFTTNQMSVLAGEQKDDTAILISYQVNNRVATVSVQVPDNITAKRIVYLRGNVQNTENPRWDSSGTDVTDKNSFEVSRAGIYSILVEDTEGNITIEQQKIELEFKAVWITYLEFKNTGYTKTEFETEIHAMFDKVVNMGMNAVVVHVRPFGDAMYPSKLYPWSKYISGKQGVDPGFDPLKLMVEAAHERGLQFHAWLNPFRVTLGSTDVEQLAKTNKARIWLTDNKTTNDRNVLSYAGNLYYNPAQKEVRNLIENGVLEIVENYDVDGIHFDDYFYPTLGANYKKVFDAKEYNEYVDFYKSLGNDKYIVSIADWRRRNVNNLISNIYSGIKYHNENVVFGISPGGFLDKLLKDDQYYVDVARWLSEPGFVDYVCPQLYWSFSHKIYPFEDILNRWIALKTNPDVKLYVGIPVYKAGSNEEPEFKTNTNILADMVFTARLTESVDGFMFYRYNYFFSKVTKKAVDGLYSIIR